jgi:hypothetical protein
VTVHFWPTGGPQPRALAGEATSPSTVGLSWADRSGGRARYEVRRDGSLIATTAAGAESYTDTGASAGTAHTYQVRAVGPWVGTGGASTVVATGSGRTTILEVDWSTATGNSNGAITDGGKAVNPRHCTATETTAYDVLSVVAGSGVGYPHGNALSIRSINSCGPARWN